MNGTSRSPPVLQPASVSLLRVKCVSSVLHFGRCRPRAQHRQGQAQDGHHIFIPQKYGRIAELKALSPAPSSINIKVLASILRNSHTDYVKARHGHIDTLGDTFVRLGQTPQVDV